MKGLTLQSSLKRYNPFAEIWILCMDDYTYSILRKLQLTNVKLISLSEFEDPKLLKAKINRTHIEYYWTCTPSLPLYVFNHFKQCEYAVHIDTDLFFYTGEENIFAELADNSIYVVEHRYLTGQKYRVNKQGRFNVGILVFKNDTQAKKCLDKWREQCIEWYYLREEEGKMGDQMYLNEWPKLYNRLTISKNLGVNAAPWNIEQYDVKNVAGEIYINSDKLICYHFHQLKIHGGNKTTLSRGYDLSEKVVKYIYDPYLGVLKNRWS